MQIVEVGLGHQSATAASNRSLRSGQDQPLCYPLRPQSRRTQVEGVQPRNRIFSSPLMPLLRGWFARGQISFASSDDWPRATLAAHLPWSDLRVAKNTSNGVARELTYQQVYASGGLRCSPFPPRHRHRRNAKLIAERMLVEVQTASHGF
jgi:hypothetical protein